MSVLLKGLKFTPTPEKSNDEQLSNDIAEFHRKIKLKEYFYCNENIEQDDSLVRNNSYFEPPRGRNQRLDEYIDMTKVIPRNDPQRKTSFNITRNERKAIDNLAKDTSIVIKEADKGGGIVIMNKEFYKRKLLQMLDDKSFYKQIENQTTKDTMKKIKKVIGLAKEITRHELNYLLDFECKPSMFYGLPKIHKSQLINNKCTQIDGEYLELLEPEDLTFRPIVAGPACETHRLSNLIDILLKPFIEKVKSYVRDDIDFLKHIPENVPQNTLLVTFDVVSLYTNISHDLGLKAIDRWLTNYPELIHKRFSKEFILESIKVILENNNFYFNDIMFNQVRGTAIGTKFAPTYATLVLAYLEEMLYSQTEIEFDKELADYIKDNWKRFLDDCFILWSKGEENLKKFHSILNNLHPDLKFTIEYNDERLPFLDVLLIKSNNRISTDIFFKETDSKQYLNFQSCHPKHTKTSIPYNLARRICTIVSDQSQKEKRLSELSNSLQKRNYPDTVISEGIKKAKSIPRNTLLSTQTQNKEEVLPYVSTFNPNNTEMFGILKSNMHILTNDQTMREALSESKIIKSKRQPPNLKRLITKAKFTEQQIKTTNKVYKCKRPNCALCECIEEGNSYNFNGKVFYVNETMSCDVKNVIYVMKCNGCKELYIGQTGDKLRTRRTIHAQQIRDPSTRQIPLSEHIDNCSQNNPKFQMFPFFKMRTESISARLAKEKHFIRCFKPKLNVL